MVRGEPSKRRLWLVFFSGIKDAWWHRFLCPGFYHVSAASWYADTQRWVYVDATRRGLVVELWEAETFGGRLGQLIRDSSVILRMPSAESRAMTPLSAHCVGTVKALLGIRSCALSPRMLFRHLVHLGAEMVEPEGNDEHIQIPEAYPGRPECDAAS